MQKVRITAKRGSIRALRFVHAIRQGYPPTSARRQKRRYPQEIPPSLLQILHMTVGCIATEQTGQFRSGVCSNETKRIGRTGQPDRRVIADRFLTQCRQYISRT